MKNNKKGFTLIELLVVIAIIGLLSTLSIVALNSARARSRDARRVSDIKQIQTALEMHFNAFNTYPTGTSTTLTSIASGTTVFMTLVPAAPTPVDNASGTSSCTIATNAYTYTMTDSGASYTLRYCLGRETGGVPAGINLATPAGIR